LIIRPAWSEQAIEQSKILRPCQREHVVASGELRGRRSGASDPIPNYHKNTRCGRERRRLRGFSDGPAAGIHSTACHRVLVTAPAGEIAIETGGLLGRWHVEAQAGSNLGLLRAKAEPDEDGSYRIGGSKIFISAGDHDLAENIIHLVLARLAGAPRGTRGISLFLVPKFIPGPDGAPGQRNDMSGGSLKHKMGINASPTCVMNYDGAHGWLIGEPHRGLAAMFTMMNAERLFVGVQGIGIAEAAYQNAVAYARERRQGRAAAAADGPQPILVHPDVRKNAGDDDDHAAVDSIDPATRSDLSRQHRDRFAHPRRRDSQIRLRELGDAPRSSPMRSRHSV
jgi:hypothetical protein